MAQSTGVRATTFLLRELIGELLYFPVWWYSRGLQLTALALYRNWRGLTHRLSIAILFRTMGKPMYGDYTRSGRIISFFFRLLLIFVRLIVILMWTIIELIALLLWLAGPAVSIGMLIRQLVPIS